MDPLRLNVEILGPRFRGEEVEEGLMVEMEPRLGTLAFGVPDDSGRHERMKIRYEQLVHLVSQSQHSVEGVDRNGAGSTNVVCMGVQNEEELMLVVGIHSFVRCFSSGQNLGVDEVESLKRLRFVGVPAGP